MKNKGNIANLKPFKKGNPGGPGVPKKLPELDKLLASVLGEEKDGITAAEAILKKLRQMAAAGNIRAAEIMLDRGYGKPKQFIESNVTQRTIIIDTSGDQDTTIHTETGGG